MADNEDLQKELKELNSTLRKLYKLESLPESFYRGIVQGLGSVIGATLVVAVLVYIVGHIELIPIIGTWLAEIVRQVQYNLLQK